jgi:hypothetical protein
MAAARRPARYEPANSQFFLPMAIGRMAFSIELLCEALAKLAGNGDLA